MANVLADLPVGEHPLEEWIAPLFSAVNGYPDQGVPFKLTEHEDPNDWALQVRNKDATNSQHLRVTHSDGVTDRLLVTDNGSVVSGLTVNGGLTVNDGLVVSPAAGQILLDDSVSISGPLDVGGSLEVAGNLGFFGQAPASQGSVASSSTDLSSVITLANSLRTLVRRYNLAP